MSDDVVIRVENLSKRYRIGAREERYKTFREAIIDGFTAPIRNLKRLRKLTKFEDANTTLWPLFTPWNPRAIPVGLHAPCRHLKMT